MFFESSTSAATNVHERHALRAARKYFAASRGLSTTGWEWWLASFQTPNVSVNGNFARKRLNDFV